MSPENIIIPTFPDKPRAPSEYAELTHQVLATFYRDGVWFGSYPRPAGAELVEINGLAITVVSPAGGSGIRVSEYCRRIRITSLVSGISSIEIAKLYTGDWLTNTLQITSSGRPVSPILRLKNGVGLKQDDRSRGTVKMVGVFMGCTGVRTQTIKDAAFLIFS